MQPTTLLELNASNILSIKLKEAFAVDDFALNPCVCIELHVRICVNLWVWQGKVFVVVFTLSVRAAKDIRVIVE
jgi:hypothetical protein